MSKKGFTIVELAIVLVIIGIILAMAVKGSELVHAARIRTEVAKISKFEAAVVSYYGLTGEMPKIRAVNDNIIDKNIFIERGILTEADFVFSHLTIASGNEQNIKWAFNRCQPMGDAPDRYYAALSATNFSNICVFASVEGVMSFYPGDRAVGVDPELICNIEIIYDDKNIDDGIGRMMNSPSVAEHKDAMDYQNCDKLPATYNNWRYAYKIF